MPSRKTFLVVDDTMEGRSLLSRTLRRKFPHAVAIECGDAATATATVRKEPVDAIVLHRAGGVEGLQLLPVLRRLVPSTPIVLVSGADRSQDALERGATTFLPFEAWLRLGTVIAELLDPPEWTSDERAAEAS